MRDAPELSKVFSASGGVPKNATSGRLALPLRFAQSTLNGATLHLATQLIDAAGRRSNCYTMDFDFDLALQP